MKTISDINDAGVYDTSSQNRTAQRGEIVVWRNQSGMYAATLVERVGARSHGAEQDELVFSYVIQSNGSASFGAA